MSLADVKSALLVELEAQTSGIPKAYPNKKFTPPNDGQWLNVTFNPSETTPVSAFKGQDQHDGFLQVDFNTPIDLGDGDLLTQVTALQAYFTAGKIFAYNSQEVKILSTAISPGRVLDNFYRISATIRWYARTQR